MKPIHSTNNNQNIALMNRFALTLVLSFASIMLVTAQPIQFAVNMEYANLERGDQVVVRGNIPELGAWESDGQLRLTRQGQSEVYQGTLNRRGIDDSQQVLYKFVILRADGNEQWEEIGNRVLDTNPEDIPWFENRNNPGISQTFVNVVFRLDLTQHRMNGYPTEGVALMGGQAPLSFDLENGRREMIQVAEGIWEASAAFPVGTPHDVAFKFAWLHQGEWMWEWRPGHTNHVFLIDDSGTEQTIQLLFDPLTPGVIPSESSSGYVDDYAHILSTLGARAESSRYQYELAIIQLRGGDQAAAEATYATYAAHHPGGEEIDDFHYQLAYHINRTQGQAAAEAFIHEQLESETIPERRAYFQYLEAEVAFNNGHQLKARRILKSLAEASDWEIVTEYSRTALVESYLREAEPDSVQRGVRLLEGFARQAPQAERREYMVRLERAYLRARMSEQREETMKHLTRLGTESQQGAAKLRLAETYTRQGRHSEAMGLLDSAEFEDQVSPANQPTLLRLRMEAYYGLDMNAEFARLYQRYQSEHPGDVFKPRLQQMNEHILERMGPDWRPEPDVQVDMETTAPDSTQNQEGRP